jgi:hypothetical protein
VGGRFVGFDLSFSAFALSAFREAEKLVHLLAKTAVTPCAA